MLKGQLPPRPALDAVPDRPLPRVRLGPARRHRQPRRTARCVHPPDVVRHDDDDPYLVVAADKGTAHLSDTANSRVGAVRLLAGRRVRLGRQQRLRPQERGHHGARRLGVRAAPLPQPGPSTSRRSRSPWSASATWRATCSATACCAAARRRLVAAFNHAHIFIDPDPDPEKSFAERERLFELPRSTWRTTTRRCISEGGGIFDRSAKAIPLIAAGAGAARHRRTRRHRRGGDPRAS